TGSQLLGQPEQLGSVARPGAASYPMDMVPIQRGSLELYGVQALAGSLRDSAGPGAGDLTRWSSTSGRFIINQAAARTLGFPSASAAIGQTIRAATFGGQPEDNRIAA